MKFVCALLVLLAVFQASESKPKFTERINIRTPFYKRRWEIAPSIVGGDPTDISEHPHHLGLLDLSWGGYICGAANISPFWAVSAAHCLEFGVPAALINLLGGSTSRFSGGTIFNVAEYILHPQYNPNTLDNDVAVLRADPSTPLTGVPFVTAAPLAPLCAAPAICCGVCVPGNNIIVAGWGANDQGVSPEMLLQVDKPIHEWGSCNAIWGGITSRMFCTAIENGRDSCQGDSGGGIMRDGILVGVVSFGTAVCGSGAAPAVYVRLEDPLVRNWISATTGI